MKTQQQNLWYITIIVPKGKLIAMCAYNKYLARSQMNNLMMHLKLSENKSKSRTKSVDGKKEKRSG
jgi:hypothetical protein